MLCPEVWRFMVPSYNIVQRRGKFDDKCSSLRNGISNHFFNQLISVVLPGISSNPEELENSLQDTDHYLVENVSLAAFINRTFVEGFIKRGSFYALSVDTKIDTDDCASVTPSGKLILHLNKETFQSLGLDGKVSEYSRKRLEKYVVQIDLKSPNLLPGTKHFDRVKACLSRDILPKFAFQCTWTPPDKLICASSMPKYFHELGGEVELVPTKFVSHQEYNLTVPEFDDTSGSDSDKEFCTPNELVEYVGMLALSCDTRAQNYLSSYDYCGASTEIKCATIMQWKGMFTCAHIESLLLEVNQLVSKETHGPWASIYVHGFPHSPISFGHRENHFHTSGDNSYAVLLTANKDYLWYQILGCSKIPK